MTVAAPAALSSVAVDTADHTAYLIDYGPNFGGPFVIDMLNTRECNAGEESRCPTRRLPIVTPSSTPDSVAIDPSTDTLYVPKEVPVPPS